MNLCNQYNRLVRFVGDIIITDKIIHDSYKEYVEEWWHGQYLVQLEKEKEKKDAELHYTASETQS